MKMLNYPYAPISAPCGCWECFKIYFLASSAALTLACTSQLGSKGISLLNNKFSCGFIQTDSGCSISSSRIKFREVIKYLGRIFCSTS